MEEFFAQVWVMLMGRSEGPLTARLLIQPTVATLLATRAGLKDARAGRPPYFWSVLTRSAERNELLQHGWQDVGKLFIAAVTLDVIYEVMVYRWVYPGQAVIVAAALAIVPYLCLRGLTTRLARLFD